jgi:hypothetical protein
LVRRIRGILCNNGVDSEVRRARDAVLDPALLAFALIELRPRRSDLLARFHKAPSRRFQGGPAPDELGIIADNSRISDGTDIVIRCA